jgi:hypothetical protein
VSAGRPAGSTFLRLYPRSWRARYEAEVLAVLEVAAVGWRGRLDLARGAIDAHLHATSRLPAAAALLAGGLWTVVGAGVLTQPVPPDWPGYLLETLPLAVVAVAVGGFATVGCWARRSDGAGRAGVVAAWLAVIGHVIWASALVAALVGIGYGPVTAIAQAAGALGCLLVGLVLLRSGDERVGGLLVVAPTLLLFGWPVAFLGFGLAWTVAGMLLVTGFGSDESNVQPTG